MGYWRSCGGEVSALREKGEAGKGIKHPCLRTLGNNERYIGAVNVNVRTSIRKCLDNGKKTVYDCNFHILAPSGWPTGFALQAYDQRANGIHEWSPGYALAWQDPATGATYRHLSVPIVLSTTSGPITQAGKVDVHYTEIAGWMPEVRKRIMAENTNRAFRAITKSQDIPGGYEFFAATKRKRDLLSYALTSDPNLVGVTNLAFFTEDAFRQYVNDTANPVVYGYHTDFDVGAEEYYEETWKKLGWGHQTMGGAKAGKPDDKWAVTDSHGRIYNLKGVRVVDAAWCPTVPMGNPWLSVSQWAAILGHFTNVDWKTGYKNLNIMPLEPDHPYYVDAPALNLDKLSKDYGTYPAFKESSPP